MARLRTADNRREFAAVTVFISTASVLFLAAVPGRARQAFEHRKSHWFFCQSGNSSPQSERLFCECIGVLWRPPFDSGSGIPTDRTNDRDFDVCRLCDWGSGGGEEHLQRS